MKKRYKYVTVSCRTQKNPASKKWRSFSTRHLDVKLDSGEVYRYIHPVEESSASESKIYEIMTKMIDDDMHSKENEDMRKNSDWKKMS